MIHCDPQNWHSPKFLLEHLSLFPLLSPRKMNSTNSIESYSSSSKMVNVIPIPKLNDFFKSSSLLLLYQAFHLLRQSYLCRTFSSILRALVSSCPINLTTPFLPHSLLPQLPLSSRWHSLEFPSVSLFKFTSFQTIQPLWMTYTSFSGHPLTNIKQTLWYIIWIPQMLMLGLYLTRCYPIFLSPTSH